MKKLVHLFFAVVSTTFLLAGATHAAEKFDTLALNSAPLVAEAADDLFSPPCGFPPEEQP